MNLENLIDATIASMRKSKDFTDIPVVSSFMILIDALTTCPRALLELENPFRLSIVLTSMVTGGFVQKYPRYYKYNTGQVACASAYYCFIKQLKCSSIPVYNLPTAIVLLHDGRQYMSDIVTAALLAKRNSSDYMVKLNYDEIKEKSVSVVRGIEYLSHGVYNGEGGFDEQLNIWKKDIEREIWGIVADIGDDFGGYAERMYEYIENNLCSRNPFLFELDVVLERCFSNMIGDILQE